MDLSCHTAMHWGSLQQLLSMSHMNGDLQELYQVMKYASVHRAHIVLRY